MRFAVGRLLLVASVCALALGAAPAGAATWSVTKLHDDNVIGPMFAASCPSPSFCVVGGSDSLVATSSDPTAGPGAWDVFHVGGTVSHEEKEPGEHLVFPGAQIRGFSCPSTSLCVGATYDGRIVSSTDPSGGEGAWSLTPLQGEKEPRIHLTGISCPSPSFCVAVAYGGKVVTSRAPTGDVSAWKLAQLEGSLDLRGVSCPTTSFCAAVGNEGKIAVSTDPGGPASAWSVVGAPGGESSLNGVSCPSPSLCVTGNAGQMISSTDPTGGLGAWHAVLAGSGLPVKGVSCPSPAACAAVDNNADAIVSTDPASGAWDFTNVIAARQSEGITNGMFAISCPATSLCLAAGMYEQIIFSTDAFATEPIEPLRRTRGLRVVITHHPSQRLSRRKHGNRAVFRFHAVGGRAARYVCKLSGRGVRRLGRHAGRRRHPGKGGGAKSGRRSASPSTALRRRPAAHRRRNHHRGHGRSRFLPCSSPARYRVGPGTHVFRVRAIAASGRKSPTTSFHFRVGALTEPQPIGSCPATASDQPPPGWHPHPCVNAR